MSVSELGLDLDLLAPGVEGYTVTDEQGELWIPVIVAQHEGKGDVGRYLDNLPREQTVRVPDVLNPRLAAMLTRRGFAPEMVYSKEFEQEVEVYTRRPSTRSER